LRAVVPPWFGPALTAGLVPIKIGIAKAYNSSAQALSDALMVVEALFLLLLSRLRLVV
jgi:hypothetical protein